MRTLLQGSDSVLLDLNILNGKMSLKFDKYVNIYTVEVASDVDSLEIEYRIEDTDEIKIINNENFNYGLNYVFLEVSNQDNKNMYTIEVYKEKIETVMKYETPTIENEKTMQKSTPYIIFTICFLIILFFFVVIFHHKKSK